MAMGTFTALPSGDFGAFGKTERGVDVDTNVTSGLEPDAIPLEGESTGSGIPAPFAYPTRARHGFRSHRSYRGSRAKVQSTMIVEYGDVTPKDKGGRRCTGRIENAAGGSLSSIHADRLEKMAAEEPLDQKRAFLLAAAECIRNIATKNRRMGAKIGASARRKALTHRGLHLDRKCNTAKQIAEEICFVAASRKVNVYVFRKDFRITTQDIPKYANTPRHVGTYDEQARYNWVLDDVREALK